MKAKWLTRIIVVVFVVVGCLLCAVLGFLVGGSIGAEASTVKVEEIDWVALGKPPVAISRIIYLTPNGVYVETIDGKIFGRDIDCVAQPCWFVLDSLDLQSSGWIDESLGIAENCDVDYDIKEPPGEIIECASLKYLIMAGGYLSVYAVLLEDGTVWTWMHGAYDIDYGITLFSTLVYGFLGICICISIYTIGVIAILLLKILISKSTKLNPR